MITLSYLLTINCKFKFEHIVSENKNARLIKGKNQPSSGNMKNKVVLQGQKKLSKLKTFKAGKQQYLFTQIQGVPRKITVVE